MMIKEVVAVHTKEEMTTIEIKEVIFPVEEVIEINPTVAADKAVEVDMEIEEEMTDQVNQDHSLGIIDQTNLDKAIEEEETRK